MSRGRCLPQHEISRQRELIIDLLRVTPMSRRELCDVTGLSLTRVDYYLGHLKDCGMASINVCGPMGACKWSAKTAERYDLDHHAPEFLGRESIFHVGMALAAGVRA